LAALRGGVGGDTSRDDIDELLLIADAAVAQLVKREERAFSLHDGWDAGFLGNGELSQQRGITGEGFGGSVFGGVDSGSVETQNGRCTFASAEGQFHVTEHVDLRLGGHQDGGEISVRWDSVHALGAADNDDVSLGSSSPWVVLGRESDRTFDEVHRSAFSKVQRTNATDEFSVRVHEFSLDGMEVRFFVDSIASESGQTELVVLQSLCFVSLGDGRDKSEEIFSLVLVADVLFKDNNSVNSIDWAGDSLGVTDGDLTSFGTNAAHAVGGSLQHDSFKLSLLHVGGGGSASLLLHGCFALSLDLENVVDAHVHEGSRVQIAEGRAESGGVVEEEFGAHFPGNGRLDVGDLVESLGVVGLVRASLGDFPGVGESLNIFEAFAHWVGQVIAGLVVVCAEETASLAKVPSRDGDGADFGLQAARDGHALLAHDGDLVDGRSLDHSLGQLDGQFADFLVDDSLARVEHFDGLVSSHHGQGIAFGSGFGASVVGDDGEFSVVKVSGQDIRAISGKFDERTVKSEKVLVSSEDSGSGEGWQRGSSWHPVVVVVHECPVDLGHVRYEFSSGCVHFGD